MTIGELNRAPPLFAMNRSKISLNIAPFFGVVRSSSCNKKVILLVCLPSRQLYGKRGKGSRRSTPCFSCKVMLQLFLPLARAIPPIKNHCTRLLKASSGFPLSLNIISPVPSFNNEHRRRGVRLRNTPSRRSDLDAQS